MVEMKDCFVICPIGKEDSEIRKRSDLLFDCIIEPVVKELGYKPIRADKINESGLITNQIIDYIIDSPLVIADLTDINPNVFYELAVRHFVGKPCIQMMRSGQVIPFDTYGMRTIRFDTDVRQADSAKKDLSEQIKSINNDRFKDNNPIKNAINYRPVHTMSSSNEEALPVGKDKELLEIFKIIPLEDIKTFCMSGITKAYMNRKNALDDMLNDIGSVQKSIDMYARVYISELIKSPEFVSKIEKAILMAPDGLRIRHVSTNYHNDSAVKSVWNREDKKHIRWKDIERYRHHLNIESNAPFEDIKELYLFTWDKILGDDNERFIEYLIQKFGIDWVRKARVEIDDGTTIKLIYENKSISLKLNNENTKANLEIDNVRTYEFIAKMENNEINIYREFLSKKAGVIYERGYIKSESPIPFSILSIDDKILYVSFYDLCDDSGAGKNYGTFAPTIRLVCKKNCKNDDKATWADLFIKYKKRIKFLSENEITKGL